MKKTLLFALLPTLASPAMAQTEGVATFENLTLAPESSWHGDENGEEWYYGLGYAQRFESGDYSFANFFIPEYDSWIGYAYSNLTSTTFETISDQYKSCVGHGVDGSANFGVAFPDDVMWGETLDIRIKGEAKVVPGFYITNSAWVVDAILNGDNMTEGSFGAGDYYKVTVHGHDAEGNEVGSHQYYLADYRFEDEADRYYLTDWEYVDLSELGEVSSLTFTLESTRNSVYGMTTPGYFCIDNLGAEGTEIKREEGTYNGPTDIIKDVVTDDDTDVIYTLQGVRVAQATVPGIYIINGKKVLVK